MMKDAFYFMVKAFLVEKKFDLKDKVDFKIYGVTIWLKNNCNTVIDQYLKK